MSTNFNIGRYDSIGETLEFDTEEEARAYVDNLGPPPAILTLTDGKLLWSITIVQYIDGVRIVRDVEMRHSGDDVAFYTHRDWINYVSTLLELDSSNFIDNGILRSYIHRPDDWVDGDDAIRSGSRATDTIPWQHFHDYFPGDDCIPSRRIKIIELDGGLEDVIEVDLDYTPIPAPTDVNITVVDGDPPAHRIENGTGSIIISDDGRIDMSNDGGSLYLNEFGHAGMYANGDVSLTAGQTAQLGVGSHSLSVVSDGFIFQRGGEMLKVSFDRMKEVFGE